MDLSVGQSRIAVSTLNLFDTLAILLLIPVFDRAIYPALKKRGASCALLLVVFGVGCYFGHRIGDTEPITQSYKEVSHNNNTCANNTNRPYPQTPNPQTTHTYIGYALTQLQKFGAGFAFAILAMLVAGGVEAYRKSQAPPPGVLVGCLVL